MSVRFIKTMRFPRSQIPATKAKCDINSSTRWFQSLAKGDQPQKQAIEHMEEIGNEILVARQTNIKNFYYGSYRLISDIFKFIPCDSDEAEKSNNHLFEIIQGGKPRKHYFDIEFLIQPNISPKKVLYVLFAEFNKYMLNFCGIDNFMTMKNTAISESSGIRKRTTNLNEASFHLVVNSEYIFKNEIEQKKVMDYFTDLVISSEDEKVKKYLICQGKPIWDTLVYTKNRQMRMVNNSKFGQTRILKVINIDDLKYHIIGVYSEFKKSLLPIYTDISNIPDYHEIVKTVKRRKIVERVKTGSLSQKLKYDINSVPPENFNSNYLRDTLFLIPNSGEYYQPYYIWYLVGKALYSLKNVEKKDDSGTFTESYLLSLWKEWTTQDKDKNYNEGDCEKLFKSFAPVQDCLQTLITFAKKCCPKALIRSVKHNAITVLFDDETDIDTFRQEVTDNNYYVCPFKQLTEEEKDVGGEKRVFENYNVIAVKAMMGTGKSYQVRQFINEMKFNRVLIISTRKSYANNVFGELNEMFNNEFKLYSDKNVNLQDDINKLVIQIHSLHKLPENFRDYELVVIDECESVLMDLTSTILRDKSTNYQNFEKLLTSRYLIFLDAFMTKRTLSLVEYVRDTYNKSPIYIKNEYMPYNYKAFKLDGWKMLCYKINQSLKEGKKIYVFTTKKSASTISKDGAEELYSTLTNKYPDKKIKLYTGDTNNKKELRNVNENWKDVDVIITTSTITVGVNFDIKHFDELFCYATPLTCTQRDIMQGLFRARHIKDKVLYYAHPEEKLNYVNEYHLDYNKFCNEFDKSLEQNKCIEKEIETDHEVKALWKDSYKWLKKIHLHNVFERNNKLENFAYVFQRYLQNSGFVRQNDDIQVEIDDMLTICKERQTCPYEYINEINQEQYDFIEKKLLNDEDVTREEKDSMIRFRFDKLLNPNINDLFSAGSLFRDIYRNPLLRDKLYNLYYEKQESLKKISDKEVNENAYRVLSHNRHTKLQKIMKLKNILGLDKSQDTKNIDKSVIEANIKEIDELYNSCNSLFDSRIRSKDDGIKKAVLQVNALLTHWGLTKIRVISPVKKVDGKATRQENEYLLDVNEKYLRKDGTMKMIHPARAYEILKEPKNTNTAFNECMID